MKKIKDLVSIIAADLKDMDFKRKGNLLYKSENGNYGLIDFQVDEKSKGKEQKNFTINLGSCLGDLRKFRGDNLDDIPNIMDCHWRTRIGFLAPVKKDYWWNIDERTNLNVLSNEILQWIKTYCISEIYMLMKNSELEKHWIEEKSEGLTDIQRLTYLTVLLKINGRKNELNESLDKLKIELEKRNNGFLYKVHLKELEMYPYPHSSSSVTRMEVE